jgi:hypothetical protein
LRWKHRKKVQDAVKHRKVKNLVFLFHEHRFYKGKSAKFMMAKLPARDRTWDNKEIKRYLYKYVNFNTWDKSIYSSNYEEWGQKYTEVYKLLW